MYKRYTRVICMNKLAKVQDLLDVQQLDALVILSDYNRRYLSDFTGTSGALIISKITIN